MKVPRNITDHERPAIKVQKGDRRGDKAPEWQSVSVPCLDRERSVAGLKQRLGRASCLPGIPRHDLGMMGGWENAGKSSSSGKGRREGN